MPRRLALCLFSALIFLLGLAAGQDLRSAILSDIPKVSPGRQIPLAASDSQPEEPRPVAVIAAAHASPQSTLPHSPTQPIILSSMSHASGFAEDNIHGVDRSTHLDSGLVAEDAAGSRTESPDAVQVTVLDAAAESTHSDSGTDSGKTQHLLQAIRQLVPDMSEADGRIWAEELSDLDLEEAYFILQQKQQSAGFESFLLSPRSTATLTRPADSLSDTLRSDARPAIDPHCPSGQHVISESPYSNVLAALQSNLAGSTIPGFRGVQVIADGVPVAMQGGSPDSLPTPPVADGRDENACDVSPPADHFRTLRRFDCGPAACTGDPLHVALPKDPHLMFSLQDCSTRSTDGCTQIVTRRGDFEVLADRTLGLRLSNRDYALSPLIRLPEDCHRAWITATGEVRYSTASVPDHMAGRVPVVQIAVLSRLFAVDGVLFHASEHCLVTAASDAEIVLRTETIELSNVSAADEWQTLKAFQRMERGLTSVRR